MTKTAIDDLLHELAEFYARSGRHDMLWRQPEKDGSFDPYKILVSELMLQQTQVARVRPKYEEFVTLFPNAGKLAVAPLGAVLTAWSGLGYNRRAKYIWHAAQMIRDQFGGTFPSGYQELVRLSGVGPNTAGAVLAYAYNQPAVFIETNIRTVIIHAFYRDDPTVPDKKIRDCLANILEQALQAHGWQPREFYWALMDYGTHLKATVGNISRSSGSYVRQPAFHGSRRQLRGLAVRLLTERPYTHGGLIQALSDERAGSVLDDLMREGLIVKRGAVVSLA